MSWMLWIRICRILTFSFVGSGIKFPGPVNPESASISDNYRIFRLTMKSVLTPVVDHVGTVQHAFIRVVVTDPDQYSVAQNAAILKT